MLQTYKTKMPVFLDFEASSLSLSNSYPIEVGFTYNDNGEEKVFSALVKPEKTWEDWCKKAEFVHGITKEELDKNGLSPYEVASEMNKVLSGKEVFVDGITYDRMWCDKLFKAADIQPEFRIKDIMFLLNESQVNNWDKVRNNVLRKTQMPIHRAGNDVWLMKEVFKETMDIHMRNKPRMRRG